MGGRDGLWMRAGWMRWNDAEGLKRLHVYPNPCPVVSSGLLESCMCRLMLRKKMTRAGSGKEI